MLTPKQMLQRLTIALAQVKASNASEKLLNEIYQIKNSLCQEKQVTRNVYNNVMNLTKFYKADLILSVFMNSKNSKPSHPHSV